MWATWLSTGKPPPGATVTVRDGKGAVTWTGTTDADGAAMLPPTSKLAGPKAPAPRPTARTSFGGGNDELCIFVQHDADWTMVNPTRSGGLAVWSYSVDVDYERAPVRLRGFMHTDHGLYRPGDQVHIEGSPARPSSARRSPRPARARRSRSRSRALKARCSPRPRRGSRHSAGSGSTWICPATRGSATT